MVKFSEVDQTLVIELQEKILDARTTKDFRREVQPQLDTHQKVVLDLSALTFVDSSGLGALLSCLRQVSSKGGDLKLCSLTTQVRAVFLLVRMHRLFDIYNTKDEAIQAFNACVI
jgi:anti-sigma B factor antagonist